MEERRRRRCSREGGGGIGGEDIGTFGVRVMKRQGEDWRRRGGGGQEEEVVEDMRGLG